MISSVVKGISGERIRRARKGYIKMTNKIDIIKNFNYKPKIKGIFSINNLPRIKDETYVIKLNDKKVEEYIGVHHLLKTYIQLYTLILLELNMFLDIY